MAKLLSDELKSLWQSVEENRLQPEEFAAEEQRLTDEYKRIWTEALVLDGQTELTPSLLTETGLYVGCNDQAEIEERCRRGVLAVRQEWEATFRSGEMETAEKFYDTTQAYVYDLMWWHTLNDDISPLAYVQALRFAQMNHCHSHLDFGSGAGAGSILFARNGFEIALADISSSLLEFSRWRLALRNLAARFFDLKTAALPLAAFDFITAMDVFEHLVDPVKAVDEIAAALTPGGYLLGRFEPSPGLNHPQHIVVDFEPTFRRLTELGLIEVWRDEWLWGHRVFKKT